VGMEAVGRARDSFKFSDHPLATTGKAGGRSS
jgi:hypothetical protein